MSNMFYKSIKDDFYLIKATFVEFFLEMLPQKKKKQKKVSSARK